MIRADGIQKSFGNVQAVKSVTFEAYDGQVTGLLGPNGAGKSTSLRMIYGLVAPDEGKTFIDDICVATEPQKARRKLGALPDAHGLYPRLTARENISYFGQLHGMSKQEIKKRIEELEVLLGMSEFIDRAVSGFSQGQRMKVSIARAIVHNPPNVILDEPTNGLDVMATRAMRDVILQMKKEGRCVLFSSHIMQEVAALCDRLVIIVGGKSVFVGSVDALQKEYPDMNLEDAFVDIVERSQDQSGAQKQRGTK
jgi:sodium transport system ATP-binding protein